MAIRFILLPEKVIRKYKLDKSSANKAAIDDINSDREIQIVVRQVKYLNNVVGQGHRAVKRVIKPMLNFKSFQPAKKTWLGHARRRSPYRLLAGLVRSIASPPERFKLDRGDSVRQENRSLFPHADEHQTALDRSAVTTVIVL
ncbi:DDE-type integrase/transposase/recombinase [Collimonas sp. OK607]|uniref:DDE-type integrase/transposase/recombinase n=1 Tax=Collimonas sp. OK607 TaxID=1798194 RepID=UPI001FCCC96F|nr:DDE-type integrase/transposase/recombinase [Collimonas sp. OK607]